MRASITAIVLVLASGNASAEEGSLTESTSTWFGVGAAGAVGPEGWAVGGTIEGGAHVGRMLLRGSVVAAAGGTALLYAGPTFGIAVEAADLWPYVGAGLGFLLYHHEEFFESKYSYSVYGAAVTPELGIIVRNPRSHGQLAISAQYVVPISLAQSSSLPSSTAVPYSGWLLASVRWLF